MKKISILGSTGSVGRNTLNVIKNYPDKFSVEALAAHSNVKLLEEQVKEFKPKIVALYDEESAKILESKIQQKVLFGIEGLKEVATCEAANLVVSAISGSFGLIPTVAAIEASKDVALANKEVLVSAGAIVMDLVKRKKGRLLPIDSEHSAIFQCIEGKDKDSILRLILTASGGPFWRLPKDQLKELTFEQSIVHPTYKMGFKISVDSSTLMNKGLELIEAHFLFGIEEEKIDVIIHPQSIIHSFVEFLDGSLLAQLSEPDMRLPIQYALSYPERYPCKEAFNFTKNSKLEFYQPNKFFVCLQLAREALRIGGSMLPFMNKANEVLVNRFMRKEIKWDEIGKKLEKLMSSHRVENVLNLNEVLIVEKLAEEESKKI